MSGGWEPLLLAATASMQTDYKSALIAVAGSVPHHLLLPECSAMMHHGGAGTCAAALTAGLPQLVCPFHFDQFSWVSSCSWLPQYSDSLCQSLQTFFDCPLDILLCFQARMPDKSHLAPRPGLQTFVVVIHWMTSIKHSSSLSEQQQSMHSTAY